MPAPGARKGEAHPGALLQPDAGGAPQRDNGGERRRPARERPKLSRLVSRAANPISCPVAAFEEAVRIERNFN